MVSARLALRLSAAVALAIGAAIFAPACGAQTCGAGQTEVCLEDGTTCTCPRPCETYDDCEATKTAADDVRFCYGGDLKLCLPKAFFVNVCRTGQACTGGLCSTTGTCTELCQRSDECESKCCAWDRTGDAKNPTCAADPAGKACLAP